MRTGEGFLCVYSITSRSSFNEIKTYHEQIKRVKDMPNPPVVIVGNKCDLEHKRVVAKEEGMNLAKSYSCKFIETSAMGKTNVDEAFYALVREIQKSNRVTEQKSAGRFSKTVKKLKHRFCAML